jgi:hypothetical protein
LKQNTRPQSHRSSTASSRNLWVLFSRGTIPQQVQIKGSAPVSIKVSAAAQEDMKIVLYLLYLFQKNKKIKKIVLNH